ncbi:DUF3253 domain-containing protein [Salinicola socius]|uniref:S-adenosylmethionine tRNA ribosyltransferase n=1 Tax=Salinicola socius TaxID=404433 RepID=A0A1Q8STE5_9GAMM|nr:DUF3253 domain-containing protein [Salinicola socius]OLO04729.1 hypothetical protein BTW07_08005 [Salinicola socius]
MTPPDDEAMRGAILAMARSRGPDKTFCPSEVARELAAEAQESKATSSSQGDDWRALMTPIRDCARVLAREGCLRVTQRGRELSPDAPWCGAIRLQRCPDSDE